ncbi:AMP-binding protein [Caulobacter sp. 17J65-9]|uniref:AMP-binding protein n=1 Tax=Caulobacter sp. 17J65-9 TaxID=2709382 RepID=UPI0013C860DA|nr:AMP-binding protein [Caulobacter sp. 17J65-9]NEX91765.1 long-chain fatty acid--CoA ligase [Caulobacter sp. 17J65-9]
MIDGSIQSFALTLDKILDYAAKWHPEAEVVTAREGRENARIGYADLHGRARRTSGVLAGFGVEKGQRVATLAWNTQAHVEAWFAIMGMGAVCHTLNPRLTAVQLAWMLDQSGARIAVVSADLLKLALEVADHAQGLERILVIDGPTTASHPRALVQELDPLIATAAADVAWGEFDETAPSGLCFTSGSTGAPKGVTYTHRSSYLHTLKMLQADVLGARTVDVVMPIVPLFHANAWGLPFALPAAGSKMVLPGRHTDGASLARLIAAEGVTIAVGVPTVFLGLCEHLEAVGAKLPSLQRIILGGAATPPALMERLERELGVVVQNSWGMTELSPVGVFGVIGEPDRAAAVSGRPALGVDLMLADETGAPLAEQRDQEGRLHVRGAAVIERYFGQSHNATNADGWFDTGDLARIDRKGNLTITGRAKDLIKSGGEWINPAEIESIVCSLPEVALAAVIGRADVKWSERPILLVELRDGHEISDKALLDSVRGQVASWWVPDAVVRLPNMPLAATGKIDKIQLRAAHGGA